MTSKSLGKQIGCKLLTDAVGVFILYWKDRKIVCVIKRVEEECHSCCWVWTWTAFSSAKSLDTRREIVLIWKGTKGIMKRVWLFYHQTYPFSSSFMVSWLKRPHGRESQCNHMWGFPSQTQKLPPHAVSRRAGMQQREGHGGVGVWWGEAAGFTGWACPGMCVVPSPFCHWNDSHALAWLEVREGVTSDSEW